MVLPLRKTLYVTLVNTIDNGLGFAISYDSTRNHITVSKVFSEGPAADSCNMVEGDRIIHIDGVNICGMAVEHVSKMLKDLEIGQSVTLLLGRVVGSPEPRCRPQNFSYFRHSAESIGRPSILKKKSFMQRMKCFLDKPSGVWPRDYYNQAYDVNGSFHETSDIEFSTEGNAYDDDRIEGQKVVQFSDINETFRSKDINELNIPYRQYQSDTGSIRSRKDLCNHSDCDGCDVQLVNALKKRGYSKSLSRDRVSSSQNLPWDRDYRKSSGSVGNFLSTSRELLKVANK